MAINPRETVQAAASGFELWYQILVPALLPFFIVADLLVSLHFVGLIGALLEPIMRPCSVYLDAVRWSSPWVILQDSRWVPYFLDVCGKKN